MNDKFEVNYLVLCQAVALHGEVRETRAGRTHSIFGAGLRIDCMERGLFPVLTSRKIFMGGILGELAAFIQGATDLASFKAFGCNYWDENAAAWHYNKGKDPISMSVGRIYGAQWRRFGVNGIDQLAVLIHSLKHDPMSRRHLLTTYDPSELGEMCLPPCHLLAQFQVREGKLLDCLVYMRSVDLCLGLPSDIVLYAALLILLANETGYNVGELQFSFGDCHVYENHLVTLDWQITRGMLHDLPTWGLNANASLLEFVPEHLELIGYKHEEPLRYAFNNG